MITLPSLFELVGEIGLMFSRAGGEAVQPGLVYRLTELASDDISTPLSAIPREDFVVLLFSVHASVCGVSLLMAN